MIFFCDANGTIQSNFGTPVYQGAANSNILYLIAPYAPASSVMVGFQLPNGTSVALDVMTPQNAIPGIQNAAGASYAGWSYVLPASVTALYGTVSAQFYFYAPPGESATPTSIIATAQTSFQIGKGVPITLPSTPDSTAYSNILNNLSIIQNNLNSGYYVASGITAWNNSTTYSANEITYYPNIGEYGAFVVSLISNNTNNAPYVNGEINSNFWKEICLFDALINAANNITAAQEAAQNAAQSAQSAAQSANSAYENAQSAYSNATASAQILIYTSQSAQAAQESASAALTSAENANQSAQNSAASAEEAERQAGYATNNASAASGYMRDALNAANSALQSKQSAETAAQNAANSATEAQGYAEYTKQLVDGLGGVYIPQGSLAFASLPAQPAAQYQGYVWNITDAFTTDSRFLEGAGESVPAGANVACVLVDGAYKYDVLSGIVDLSNYAQINGTYAGMTVGNATNATNAQTATNAQQLGGVAASNYAQINGTYSGMTVGNATNATNADASTRAQQDGNGANIAQTYATIAYVDQQIGSVDQTIPDLGVMTIYNPITLSVTISENTQMVQATINGNTIIFRKVTNVSSPTTYVFQGNSPSQTISQETIMDVEWLQYFIAVAPSENLASLIPLRYDGFVPHVYDGFTGRILVAGESGTYSWVASPLPNVSASNNGMILGVSNGAYALVNQYIIGTGLTLTGDTVSVNVATAVESGNSLPVSSDAVYQVVGNIDTILESI